MKERKKVPLNITSLDCTNWSFCNDRNVPALQWFNMVAISPMWVFEHLKFGSGN